MHVLVMMTKNDVVYKDSILSLRALDSSHKWLRLRLSFNSGFVTGLFIIDVSF